MRYSKEALLCTLFTSYYRIQQQQVTNALTFNGEGRKLVSVSFGVRCISSSCPSLLDRSTTTKMDMMKALVEPKGEKVVVDHRTTEGEKLKEEISVDNDDSELFLQLNLQVEKKERRRKEKSKKRIISRSRYNDKENDNDNGGGDDDDDFVVVGEEENSQQRKNEFSFISQEPSELPYSSALKALHVFHSTHGHVVIPRRYIVPMDANEYPREWRGVDISSVIYNMTWWQRHIRNHPNRVTELNEIGFVWERLQPEWNLILEALMTYSNLEKTEKTKTNNKTDEEEEKIRRDTVLNVPTSFVVPYGNNLWSRGTWGLKLGSCVNRIRTRNDYVRGHSDRMDQLDNLGFVWDKSEIQFQKTVRALKFYGTMKKQTKTKKSGCRDDSSTYQFTKKNSSSFYGQQQQEHRQGSNNKTLRVPQTFVIPKGYEHGWPKDLWGYPLGAKCSAIQQKGLYVKNHPHRLRALESIGFQWRYGNATLGWLKVVHASAIYSQMNDRILNVPQTFVVPRPPRKRIDKNGKMEIIGSDDAWPWPEYLWGFPLGQRLKDVRLKGAYIKGKDGIARKAQLDALGFEWSPKRGRRPLLHS